MQTTGCVVAGLSGGSGKSVVSVGLTAALSSRGLLVVPFKKGPDYIDAGWLKMAAGGNCYNLDPYLIPEDVLRTRFRERAATADRVIIEGNRGLYDGVTTGSGYATADLALLLDLPVLLVVNCTKTTRTVAALVLGCQHFEPRLRIGGVILNQIATSRQQRLISTAVAETTGLPVLGALPRMEEDIFPMRHLGMLPYQEYQGYQEALAYLAGIVTTHCDVARIEEMMAPLASPLVSAPAAFPACSGKKRIAVLQDAAFQFYYAENLQALQQQGAELIPVNALTDPSLPPDLDGLYIGGGFPETSARELSKNVSLRAAILDGANKGLPIYAECGGLIYLGESICLDGETFPLCGVFPVRFGMAAKPQAHGYSCFVVERTNPFYRLGTTVSGHEFRYSTVLEWRGDDSMLALRMTRGKGFFNGRDGLCRNNVLALYTHIHADGQPDWARNFTNPIG